MEKEFILYEQALALKELGFDEPCFGYYTSPTGLLLQQPTGGNGEFVYYAPLYQQAFRWFREKYNMVGQVNVCTYFIYDMSNNDGFHTTLKMIKQYDRLCNNYEESEFECLKKLIELVKNK